MNPKLVKFHLPTTDQFSVAVDKRLERWMLLVSSATMMPTTMYPEGQYQCLRNHIDQRLSDKD